MRSSHSLPSVALQTMATQPSVTVMDERYSLTFSDAVHACVRACVRAWTSSYDAAYVRGRLACVLACMRSCVRAWTSSYDAACVRGRLEFVITCMRAAFARGRLPTMSRACVAVLRSFSCACVLRAYVLACVDVSRACVDVFMHTCRLFFM